MRLSKSCGMKAVLALGFAVLLFGCRGEGLDTERVTGRVLLDGRPLAHGTVTFVPEQGRAATGEIREDGTFRLSTYGRGDGATIGPHKVGVTCTEEVVEDRGTGDSLDAGLMPAATRSLIPRRYTRPDTSGLTFEVEPGKTNEVVLELSSR